MQQNRFAFRSRRVLSMTSFCTLMLLTFHSGATADETKPAAKKSDAVRILFDGKTLKGWEVVDTGSSGGVEVRDGSMVLKTGEPISSIVWKGDQLPLVNYELTMQARRVDGSDFFATLTFPVKDSFCSLVMGGWGGGLVGLSSVNGADASENETTDYFTFEKNRWYKIRLRVTDTKIQAWIDDKQIANLDYSDKKISVRIEMELSKPLGLSSFQTTGEIRDIQIRGLSAKDKEQADR